MTTEAMAERARIVRWLRKQAVEDYGLGRAHEHLQWWCANAIERGDHDYIAIPRLSGDQGAK